MKEDIDKKRVPKAGIGDKAAQEKVNDEQRIEEARARVVRLSDILLEKNKEKIVDSWVAHTVHFSKSKTEKLGDSKEDKPSTRPLELVGKEMESVLQQVEMEKSLILGDADSKKANDKSSESSSVVTVVQKRTEKKTSSGYSRLVATRDTSSSSDRSESEVKTESSSTTSRTSSSDRSGAKKAVDPKAAARREELKSSMTLDLTKKTSSKRTAHDKRCQMDAQDEKTKTSKDGGSVKGASFRSRERSTKVTQESLEKPSTSRLAPPPGAAKGSMERSSSESSKDSTSGGARPKSSCSTSSKASSTKKPPRWK